MATIKVENFNGLIPRLHPTLLPVNAATVAHNLVLKDGKVKPLKQPLSKPSVPIRLENGLQSIGSAVTIYPWRRTVAQTETVTILAWPGRVRVTCSNLSNDDRDRIFVTGETGIPHGLVGTDPNQPSVYLNNQTDGTITRRTLIKNALEAPVVSVSGSTRSAYFYQTWVDKYGYESPASPASEMVTYDDGNTVDIAAVAKPDDQAVTRRIYKTIAGTSEKTDGTQFVTEFTGVGAWDAQTFSVTDDKAGEAMPLIENPDIRLQFMTYVSGGYYVGFTKNKPNTVMFTEIGLPYSWPEKYQYDVGDNIVGLAVARNAVFVMTDNYAWILRGTSPETMVVSALSPAACISPDSICVYNNNVFYATNEGLAVIRNDANEGDVVQNFTQKLFTREQWTALNPSSLKCCVLDGRAYLFFENASYVIDMNEQADMLTTHDELVKCACVEPGTDKMYFVRKATA